jgi:hypothetical protein
MTEAKKPAAKKAPVKKPAAKKAPVKKPAAKKAAAKDLAAALDKVEKAPEPPKAPEPVGYEVTSRQALVPTANGTLKLKQGAVVKRADYGHAKWAIIEAGLKGKAKAIY